MPNELELIPEDMRTLSASDREIVLPYDAVLKAIAHLCSFNIALGGWEGWVVYSDGSMGHDWNYQGGIYERDASDEPWEIYVARSTSFCIETIKQDYNRWKSRSFLRKIFSREKDLYFCLSCHVKSES